MRSPVRAALPRRTSLRSYVKIDKFDLSSEVLVIAEIGNNHEGDFGLAREMVHAAAAAGAQAVKFQTIVPGKLVSALHPARLEQLGRFAFPREQFAQLAEIARDAGLLFLSTPFDVGVVSWLNELVPAFKIASGDNDYEPLLEAVAATGKPVILSTGMSGIGQIAHSCAVIESVWQRAECVADIALLHCVSSYPTPPDEAPTHLDARPRPPKPLLRNHIPTDVFNKNRRGHLHRGMRQLPHMSVLPTCRSHGATSSGQHNNLNCSSFRDTFICQSSNSSLISFKLTDEETSPYCLQYVSKLKNFFAYLPSQPRK